MLKIVIKMLSICVNAHLENQNRSGWIFSRFVLGCSMRDHTNVRTNASFSHTLSPELNDLRITMIKLYYQFIPETLTSSRIKERKLNKMQLILNGFSPT